MSAARVSCRDRMLDLARKDIAGVDARIGLRQLFDLSKQRVSIDPSLAPKLKLVLRGEVELIVTELQATRGTRESHEASREETRTTASESDESGLEVPRPRNPSTGV